MWGVVLAGAVCAARPAPAFEIVPRATEAHRSHRAAWACAVAGASLIGLSFPLAEAADRRYGEYLRETRPDAIPGRWDATVRADRMASASLLGGEALLVGAAWLGFVHPGPPARVSLRVEPARCAVCCRF